MSGNGATIELFDYSGGRNSNDAQLLVPTNQSIDAQNINLLDRGFKKRLGNSVFNSSAMVGATTAIQGLGYVKYSSGLEYLNAVAGTKFFYNQSLTGTMSDGTGTLTISSGNTNIWTPLVFNDLQIWFGGAPNAPFKFASSGTSASALSGSPPSAVTGFVANNRVFAISDSNGPSTVYWCVLNNPEDWTGSGSGSNVVGKLDGENLQCGIPVDTDVAILFKNSSTHMMVITQAPFPVYQLQKGVGVCGPRAAVSANGVIYFITPQRRMKATRDGRTFTDFPDSVNDLWDQVPLSQLSFIHGIYFPSLYQIHWLVTIGSGTTKNASIVWDIRRNAWLYNPTGFKANVACLAQNTRLFTGHYNGKVYEQNVAAKYADDSESNNGVIDAYWRFPWLKGTGLSEIIHPNWIDFSFLTETAGTVDLSYGFDFAGDQTTQSFTIQAAGGLWDTAVWDTDVWGGQTATIQRIYVYGRGNTFTMRVRHTGTQAGFTFQGASIALRGDKARKVFSAV